MKISVIIPAYNRVETIARAIDSVRSQTLPPYEIIVVDDGSTDATSEVVKMYDEVLLLRQNRQGVSAARNNGAMMAGGDWLAFLDSDDTWQAQKLEKQAAFHESHPEYDISYTDEMWIRDGKAVALPKKYKKPAETTFENSLSFCSIAPSSVMMKKGLFDSLGGFDESLEVCEDYDLWLRILAGRKIGLLPEALITKYGGHPDQLSTKYWGMDRFRVRALEKHLEGPKDIFVRNELIQKYEQLMAGAVKHGREDDVARYRARIEQLAAGC